MASKKTPPQHNKVRAPSLPEVALEAAGDIAYAWDLDSDSLTWHVCCDDMFAKGDIPTTGDDVTQRLHPADVSRRLKALSRHLNESAPFEVEYRIRNRHGVFVWAHDRGAVTRHPNGTSRILHGVIRVVEARKEREKRLAYRAHFDELTGHFNRARLSESLGRAILTAHRHQTTGVYMAVAPHHFQPTPNTDGMQDRALSMIGQQLDRSLRVSDIVGRAAQDHLGIVLPQCDEAQAVSAAQKIMADMRAHAGGHQFFDLAIGLVSFPALAETVSEAMNKAEACLRQSMQSIGDTWVTHALSDHQRQQHRQATHMAETVKQALVQGRMTLFFQPLLRAADGKVACHECLLRMRTRDNTLVQACDFVPLTESLGLSRLIDRYVLDAVVGHLEADPDLVLAMNISAITVNDQAWLRLAVNKLKTVPAIAKRMIIEITETSIIRDLEECAHFVETVHGLGCRVALDDFGAGHTSFRHLKSIPADVIKIAGTYIRDLEGHAQNRAFVETMIELAHGFGLQVVAEWVESHNDANLLTQMGADLLQGNYCGRAEPTPHPTPKEPRWLAPI